MQDLAVLIVNWNVRELLRACLESVLTGLDGLDAKVWVVDNASQDGSVEMIQETFDQVRLITSQENLGFAGGNNLALRQMEAQAHPPRYVWLLNPDTEVHPHAARALVSFMDQHTQVGVTGARLYYGDGRFQHSAFGFPGLWQILFDLFPLPGRLYASRLNGRYPRAWYERGAPFAVDHPLGAAMMVRWEIIRQVGLLDEGFHIYCEEVDWCLRIKRAGWEIYCVPWAKVVHHEGESARQIREASFVNLWRSRRRFYDKHYGPLRHRMSVYLVRLGMRYKMRLAQQNRQQSDETTASLRACHRALALFETKEHQDLLR